MCTASCDCQKHTPRVNVGIGQLDYRTAGGRKYVVAPVVMAIDDVVMNKALLPKEEYCVEKWNGVPLTLHHPKKDGVWVSAKDPDVASRFCIGTIRNPRVNGKKLMAEAWVDVERTTKIGPQVMAALTRGDKVDVSTGFFGKLTGEPGVSKGRRYQGVYANVEPDHLAILLDEPGACSWNDGCGIRANTGKPMKLGQALAAVAAFFRNDGRVVANEFDESKVSRDDAGRFSSGGGGSTSEPRGTVQGTTKSDKPHRVLATRKTAEAQGRKRAQYETREEFFDTKEEAESRFKELTENPTPDLGAALLQERGEKSKLFKDGIWKSPKSWPPLPSDRSQLTIRRNSADDYRSDLVADLLDLPDSPFDQDDEEVLMSLSVNQLQQLAANFDESKVTRDENGKFSSGGGGGGSSGGDEKKYRVRAGGKTEVLSKSEVAAKYQLSDEDIDYSIEDSGRVDTTDDDGNDVVIKEYKERKPKTPKTNAEQEIPSMTKEEIVELVTNTMKEVVKTMKPELSAQDQAALAEANRIVANRRNGLVNQIVTNSKIDKAVAEAWDLPTLEAVAAGLPNPPKADYSALSTNHDTGKSGPGDAIAKGMLSTGVVSLFKKEA